MPVLQIMPEKCQDLRGICQEPASQRLHLHTVLTHTRPIIPSRSQTASTQKGGAAVTGLWPPSIKSAAPVSGHRRHRSQLQFLPSSKASAGSAHSAGPAPKIPTGRPQGLKFRIFFVFWSLWSPIFPDFLRSLFDWFFASFFDRFLARFEINFEAMFDNFRIILASLFRAWISERFLIDFWSDFGPLDPQNVWFS